MHRTWLITSILGATIFGRNVSLQSMQRSSAQGRLRENFCFLSPQIIKNIRANDTQAIEQWIKQEPFAINARDAQGLTALMHAIHDNRETIIKKLVDAEGIDVNLADNQGSTAFAYALHGNRVSALEMLFDVEACYHYQNAITYALSKEYLEIVRLILKNQP